MKKPAGRVAETWGLGATAGALLVVLALTGMVLLFHYRPVPGLAWADVVDLREVSKAGFLRRVHYWSAQILLIVVWLHLLRVFLSGRHRLAKRGNWAVGVFLLVMTLGMAATGHLLPWDQQAVSAWGLQHLSAEAAPVTSATELGERHLLWAYAVHCVVLPLLLFGLLADHWRRYQRDRSVR